jgi:hypothetical protein
MSGIDLVASNSFSKAVRHFDPDKKGTWAVFGSPLYAQLVKSTGRRVINGTMYAPDLEKMRRIDPQGSATALYNRYAHITLTLAPSEQAPQFKLLAPDAWELAIDPCSQAFLDLGVSYLVFPYTSPNRELSCWKLMLASREAYIYKRIDKAPTAGLIPRSESPAPPPQP